MSAHVTLHVAGYLRVGRVVLLEREDHSLALWLVYPDGQSERLDHVLEDDHLGPRRGLLAFRTDGLHPVILRELEREGIVLRVGRFASHAGGGQYDVIATAMPLIEATRP